MIVRSGNIDHPGYEHLQLLHLTRPQALKHLVSLECRTTEAVRRDYHPMRSSMVKYQYKTPSYHHRVAERWKYRTAALFVKHVAPDAGFIASS